MCALSNPDLRILNYVEQTYWEHGMMPSNEQVAKRLSIPINDVKRFYQNEDVEKVLTNRGLVPNADTDLLSSEQLLTINILLNTHDRRSIREKLKLINVKSAQYHSWLRQPAFQNYLLKRAETQLKGTDGIAYSNLVSAVERGDLNAIKYFFELRGVYRPNQTGNDVDPVRLITQVVEILSKYVTAEVLANVAAELEALSPNLLRSRPIDTVVSRELPSYAGGHKVQGDDRTFKFEF